MSFTFSDEIKRKTSLPLIPSRFHYFPSQTKISKQLKIFSMDFVSKTQSKEYSLPWIQLPLLFHFLKIILISRKTQDDFLYPFILKNSRRSKSDPPTTQAHHDRHQRQNSRNYELFLSELKGKNLMEENGRKNLYSTFFFS